jgi:type II restriction/modification system DNA methylase subunit YeeA
MDILAGVSGLDWSSIEPSILGTLFERSLDPSKRSQIGAHYTSKEDILLVVEPVLMAPLRRRWADVQEQARGLAAQGRQAELDALLAGFAGEIASVQALDPASGSGNFLYIALKRLLDLQKEVIVLARELGAQPPALSVSPAQLHGVEINAYAHELAQATVWIGYLQWLRENGYGFPPEPILKPLETVRHMDAILAYDDGGRPVEPEWPAADVVIGNPPFLGGKRLRTELGDRYVDDLFSVYAERVAREADLVCYWFERARALIEAGKLKRVGLLATQGIRGGANRKVLERIKQTGDIFWAQSDRDWVLDGATVHVSMVGFDGGEETSRFLDGRTVNVINPDLTGALDLTVAQRFTENANLAFMGDTKGGAFDIESGVAEKMLNAPINPNGRSNSDVLRPWVNGQDVTGRPRGMWIIDFGVEMAEEEASLFEMPFQHVLQHVKPARTESRTTRAEWWLHERPRPEMRTAVAPLRRSIVTPRVSKHRLFVWMDPDTLADSATIVIARDDDYFFGVLHSKAHELWARGQGTQLREAESGFRYTPTTTFETFPFPWPPGREPVDDPRVQAVARRRASWSKSGRPG